MSTILRAKSCFIDNELEGSWLTIANKLLEDVFAQPELEGMLYVKDVQYSDINSPTLLLHVHNIVIPTKKADLVVAMSAHAPTMTGVYTALRTLDPAMQLSQMSETSVSRLALPGCIEVGEPGKSYLETSLQLGVWYFAGLAKHDELKMRSGIKTPRTNQEVVTTVEEAHTTVESDMPAVEMDHANVECSLPIFELTAIGMDWKLHIAYRDTTDDGVVVLGPLDSGGLGSVTAFFKLFQTATALAKWVKETYWGEFRRIVGTQST